MSSKYRVGSWNADTWEPGLALVKCEVQIKPNDCRFTVCTLAIASLHALARRFQRSKDASDAAVKVDLAGLMTPPLLRYRPSIRTFASRAAADALYGYLVPVRIKYLWWREARLSDA